MSDERTDRSGGSRKKARPILLIAALVLIAAVAVLAAVRLHSWRAQREETRMMTLVNPWNSMESTGYKIRLTSLEDVQVDKSMVKALENMMADCRAAGRNPQLISGYLDREAQEERFERESLADPASAEETVTHSPYRPGYCEQELGLSVEITGAAEDTATAEWLHANCWRYGFILRYPKNGAGSTGIAYCDSIYRYVGDVAAEQIAALGVTLEEYQGLFYGESAEVIFE